MKILEPGDVLLRGYNKYLDGRFIPDEKGYSHAGIYVGDNEVIHAVSPSVERIHLVDFCVSDRIMVLRPQDGALEAIKGTEAKLFRPKPADYKSVEVPKGKICTEAKVERDLMEADCLINMPVAKHHSGATLTISMKNWMGAVDNGTRRAWHRNGLHQCIADLSTFLKPHLVVIDATRIMLDHGPQGPGKLAHPNEIIFATDPVAADTYAASLFKKTPDDVPYIKIASEMGIGCCDIKKIKVERVEVEA